MRTKTAIRDYPRTGIYMTILALVSGSIDLSRWWFW